MLAPMYQESARGKSVISSNTVWPDVLDCNAVATYQIDLLEVYSVDQIRAIPVYSQ